MDCSSMRGGENRMSFPALTGEVDNRDEIIHQLRETVADLRRDLELTRAELSQGRRGVARLRQQLTPLHQALKDVFGEMDVIGESENARVADGPQISDRKRAVWESWK